MSSAFEFFIVLKHAKIKKCVYMRWLQRSLSMHKQSVLTLLTNNAIKNLVFASHQYQKLRLSSYVHACFPWWQYFWGDYFPLQLWACNLRHARSIFNRQSAYVHLHRPIKIDGIRLNCSNYVVSERNDLCMLATKKIYLNILLKIGMSLPQKGIRSPLNSENDVIKAHLQTDW